MSASRFKQVVLAGLALMASGCIPDVLGQEAEGPLPGGAAPQQAPPPVVPPAPEPPPSRTVAEVLDSGTVIVVSLASQRMHVFRDGALWRSSPVSTGRRGKRTPLGVFAVLQKKKFHRSNLYSNAPMPFMQRLTWGGIAIHAGHLPGYPASHGCIRVPAAFARDLYQVTNPAATAVIIVEGALADPTEALTLARQNTAVVPISPHLLRRAAPMLARKPDEPAPRLAAARIIDAPQPGADLARDAAVPQPKGQTIQLAAAASPGVAKAHWAALSGRRPELRAMQVAIIPALVNGTRYYRLRASAPDAHATCKALRAQGIACFAVS